MDPRNAHNERWDDRDHPGGYVCATCGVPVESEPCSAHEAKPPLGSYPCSCRAVYIFPQELVSCRSNHRDR